MTHRALRLYASALVYGLALTLVGCALFGAVVGGTVGGAAVAGPPGALAGAAGGAIGYGWTEIVNWWHNLWAGLSGSVPTKVQVKTVTDTFATIKWIVIAAIAWAALKALLGPRYRSLMVGFLADSIGAIKALATLKPGAAWTTGKSAVRKARQASGMAHSDKKPPQAPGTI